MAGLLASGAASIALKMLPWVATAGVGLAAGIAYEHKAPWALGGQLSRLQASIPSLTTQAAKAGADGQTKVDAAAFQQWSARVADLNTQLTAARDQQSQAIATGDAYAAKQTSAAFQLGRASCGSTNASNSHPGPGGKPSGVPVGTDLASLFQPGAYTPAADPSVPGSRQGADGGRAASATGR